MLALSVQNGLYDDVVLDGVEEHKHVALCAPSSKGILVVFRGQQR